MIDLALCMTVNPGWGGQRFIDATRATIARLRELLPEPCAIEVDGGIDASTGQECVQLGANLLSPSRDLWTSFTSRRLRELAAAVGAH